MTIQEMKQNLTDIIENIDDKQEIMKEWIEETIHCIFDEMQELLKEWNEDGKNEEKIIVDYLLYKENR